MPVVIDSTYWLNLQKWTCTSYTTLWCIGPCQVQNPYLQSHDACWTWIDCPSVSLRRAQDFQDFRSSKGTEIKYKRDTSQQSGKRHESMQNLSFGTRDKVFPCDPEFETWDCFHHPLPAATCQPKKARRWNYHSKFGYFTNLSFFSNKKRQFPGWRHLAWLFENSNWALSSTYQSQIFGHCWHDTPTAPPSHGISLHLTTSKSLFGWMFIKRNGPKPC